MQPLRRGCAGFGNSPLLQLILQSCPAPDRLATLTQNRALIIALPDRLGMLTHNGALIIT